MSQKVNARVLRSHRIHCPYKVRLTMENAQEYLLAAQKDTKHYKNPENLELYVCTSCSFLHIGHHPRKRAGS